MKQKSLKKNYLVSSDLSEVQKTSKKVLLFLKPLDLNSGTLFDIRLCLEEALINAMKYGNDLKKNLKVNLTVAFDKHQVWLSVEDQGKGFDPNTVSNCTKKKGLMRDCGRGVYLMHRLMDKVQYNQKGNRVEMVKLFKRRANHGS